MAADIERVTSTIEEGVGIPPGQMVEMETPAGLIQVIGTERGFAIRRPEARSGQDIRYENGEKVTFTFKDGTVKTITAVAPEDWQANEMLDPLL